MGTSALTSTQVQFHDSTLFIVNHNKEPYTLMKPIVEGMGMAWQTQHRKLMQNQKRWNCITLMVIQSKDTQSRETLCMPVRKLPAYFSSLQPNRVKADIRDKVILYQEECDDALWKYWTEGVAVNHRVAPVAALPATKEERKALVDLVRSWASITPLSYATAHKQVNAIVGVSSIGEMTLEQVAMAMDWVKTRIEEMHGEQKALPEPEPKAKALIPQVPAELSRAMHTRIHYLRRAVDDARYAGQQLFDVAGSMLDTWPSERRKPAVLYYLDRMRMSVADSLKADLDFLVQLAETANHAVSEVRPPEEFEMTGL